MFGKEELGGDVALRGACWGGHGGQVVFLFVIGVYSFLDMDWCLRRGWRGVQGLLGA